MKKVLSIILICVMFLTLVACSLTNPGATSTDQAGNQSETPPSTEQTGNQPAEPITIRFATVKSQGEVMCDGYRAFEEYVETESGGSIQVDIYYSSTLYSDTDVLMAMSAGNCEMGIAGSDKAAAYVPALNCLSMGYLLTSPEHLLAVLNSDIGESFSQQLIDAIGVRMYGAYYNGARAVNLRMDKEIVTPSDLNGVQLRIPGSEAYINLAKAMGASPVSMTLTEVYTALQNGTIDGQENPLPTILTEKFYEVTKSITLTNHIIGENYVYIAEAFYQSLSDDQRKILDDGLALLCDTVTKIVKEEEVAAIETLEGYGVKVYQPDTTQMRDAVIAWYYDNPDVMAGWDADVLDQIMAMAN